MTDTEKLDYILFTLQAFQQLIPKTNSVVLDSHDDKLHQLSARTKVALSFAKELSLDSPALPT